MAKALDKQRRLVAALSFEDRLALLVDRAKTNGSSAPNSGPATTIQRTPAPAANRIRLTVSCAAVDIHCNERSFQVDLLRSSIDPLRKSSRQIASMATLSGVR